MSSASIAPTNPSGTLPATLTDRFDPDEDERPQWLLVRSGEQTCAIPVTQVREVVRPQGLRPVPGAPPIQAGIVNVRGAIVTVLDLRALRSGERAVTPGSIVLLQYGPRVIGLAVDVVLDVRIAEASALDAEVEPLDAVALCTRHLHSAEERTR